MPAADTVLLPLCVALSVVGLLIAVLAFRGGRRGRGVQGVGLALAPVALYFTGLLRLVWDAVVAIVGWAARVVFSPTVWLGLSLLAVCVVLWVVGGLIVRHSAPRALPADGADATTASAKKAIPTGKSSSRPKTPGRRSAAVDPELDEIEALLKSRGID